MQFATCFNSKSSLPFRSFEKRNLAQMKTVHPSAFIFRQEKNIPGNYDRKKYEQFQLTIESNTDEDGSGESVGGAGSKGGKGSNGGGCLGASTLIRRRKVFNRNLEQIVRRHHKARETVLLSPSKQSHVSDLPSK